MKERTAAERLVVSRRRMKSGCDAARSSSGMRFDMCAQKMMAMTPKGPTEGIQSELLRSGPGGPVRITMRASLASAISGWRIHRLATEPQEHRTGPLILRCDTSVSDVGSGCADRASDRATPPALRSPEPLPRGGDAQGDTRIEAPSSFAAPTPPKKLRTGRATEMPTSDARDPPPGGARRALGHRTRCRDVTPRFPKAPAAAAAATTSADIPPTRAARSAASPSTSA
jgi:hypothetical protein